MHYIKMEHLQNGMVLGKSIVGDNGQVLLNAGNVLSPSVLARMVDFGFQGAYVDNPVFSDIQVEDIIDTQLSLDAFAALSSNKIETAISIAKKMFRELKYKEVVNVDLLDIKSDKNYVFKHSISVAVFSIVIGIGLQLNEEQLENLAIAGLLHDIGKLHIDKKILYSKNKYSTADMDEMKKHPIIAYEMLKEQPLVSSVSRNAILFHHENIDGTGYYQNANEQIGIFPRILRVADVYDSMTTLKKYRDSSSPSQAIEYIMAHAGSLFDSAVVDVFVKKFPLYPKGFTLLLSDKTLAVVTDSKSNSMRPKVRLFNGKNVDLASDPAYRSVTIAGII